MQRCRLPIRIGIEAQAAPTGVLSGYPDRLAYIRWHDRHAERKCHGQGAVRGETRRPQPTRVFPVIALFDLPSSKRRLKAC